MITLPIQLNTTSFVTDITLDNKIYKFKYVYNVRDSSWLLAISDQADAPLLDGIKLVTNWEFLQKIKNKALPPGALLAIDTISSNAPIARDDLGNRIKMIYFTETEVQDLALAPAATAAPLSAVPP